MSTNQRTLVAFVDALGPHQIEQFGPRLHFVPQRRALRGVMGYTSGALASLLTGKQPDQHGRLCLFTHAAQGPSVLEPLRWLGLLPRIIHERQAVRRRVARWFARTRGLSGYLALHKVPPEMFRWLDVPEREDLFQAADIGGQSTFLAQARDAELAVYAAPWQVNEAERFGLALAEVKARLPDLCFLYAAGLDGVLHAHGNASRRATETLSGIADHIERVRDVLATDGAGVTTLVVGDHGMADITTIVDPRPVLDDPGPLKLFADATMLRVWGDEKSRLRLRGVIERRRWPGQWLDAEALRDRAVPTQGSPYGNAIFLLEEGAMLAPNHIGGAAAGMHGYDASCFSMASALASDREIPQGVTSLTDVASMVRGSLGLAS